MKNDAMDRAILDAMQAYEAELHETGQDEVAKAARMQRMREASRLRNRPLDLTLNENETLLFQARCQFRQMLAVMSWLQVVERMQRHSLRDATRGASEGMRTSEATFRKFRDSCRPGTSVTLPALKWLRYKRCLDLACSGYHRETHKGSRAPYQLPSRGPAGERVFLDLPELSEISWQEWLAALDGTIGWIGGGRHSNPDILRCVVSRGSGLKLGVDRPARSLSRWPAEWCPPSPAETPLCKIDASRGSLAKHLYLIYDEDKSSGGWPVNFWNVFHQLHTPATAEQQAEFDRLYKELEKNAERHHYP